MRGNGRRVDPDEFRARGLRCHLLLHDSALHDVWRIDLRGGGPDRTMLDIHPLLPALLEPQNRASRYLFALRWAIGRLFRWDENNADRSPELHPESYIHRLTEDDRTRSLLPPGTPAGPFRVLYVLPNEAAYELRNSTVHGFLVTTLEPAADGYTVQWAIYVKPVSRLTSLYMAAIDPFRRFIIYPALIKQLEASWATARG